MSWGLTEYGLSPYGLGGEPEPEPPPPVGPSMYCRIVSEREIEVTFDNDILAVSQIGYHDALNPASWSVVSSTLGSLPILAVTAKSVDGVVVENTYIIYLLPKLNSFLIEHTVYATVLGDDGSTDRSESVVLPGCLAAPQAQANSGPYDFESFAFDTTRPANTLSVQSTGDYRLQGGNDFWQKMIIRRLSTLPGGYFHLPDFGIGLRVNEPIFSNDLVALRAQIQRELLKEQRFQDVSTRLQLFSDGHLVIEVRVKLVDNQNVSMAIEAKH
jgi:hypothetical protein